MGAEGNGRTVDPLGKRASLVCAGLSFLLLLATVAFAPLIYEINDDIIITALLKGLFGMPAGTDGIFLSHPASWLLAAAYRLFPSLHWYSLTLYTGLWLAAFCAMVLVLSMARDTSIRAAGLIVAGSFVFLLAVQITFTAVAVMLWVTGVTCLTQMLAGNVSCRWLHRLAAVQLALAILLRPDILPLLMLLASPLLLALLKHGSPRMALLILGPLLLALGANLACEAINSQTAEYREYRVFNKVRSDFTDTTRSVITEKTDQALAAVGWSNLDRMVARNWWFHDGQVFSADKLDTFLEINSSRGELVSMAMFRDNFVRYKFLIPVLAGWLVFLLQRVVRERWKRLLGFIDLLLIAGVVVVLLAIRFPPRIAYPVFFLCTLLLLGHAIMEISRPGRRSYRWSGFLFCGLLLVANVAEASKRLDTNSSRDNQRKYLAVTQTRILQALGEDILIAEVTPHTLPMGHLPFQENAPMLATPVLTGGFLVGSPPYLGLLARHGLGDRMTVVPAMIDNPQVVLRYWDTQNLPFDSYVQKVFLGHLQQRYSGGRRVSAKIVMDARQDNYGPIYFRLVTAPM